MIAATVSGNLGLEATLKEVDGTPVLEFSVASRRYDKKAGGETTDWVRVSFWGSRGPKIHQYLTKGQRVCVRGSLYGRAYTHNNENKCELVLRADDIELMGSRSDSPTASNGANGGGSAKDEIPF